MVFHPHGWIKAEQVIDFIDHAVEKHGKKVKFLTFKEAHARLQKSLFRNDEWRACADSVFILDVNNDGYMDIVDLRTKAGKTYLWDPELSHWQVVQGPGRSGAAHHPRREVALRRAAKERLRFTRVSIFIIADGLSRQITQGVSTLTANNGSTTRIIAAGSARKIGPKYPSLSRLLDIDGDGICEMLGTNGKVYRHEPGKAWQRLPFDAPMQDPALASSISTAMANSTLFAPDESAYSVHRFQRLEVRLETNVAPANPATPARSR